MIATGELGDPAITVQQIDVRGSDVHAWAFHHVEGEWWEVEPDGTTAHRGSDLADVLRASRALAPIPWCAMAIEAHPHTDAVLAELAVRLTGNHDRSVLDAEWSREAQFAFYGALEFWANHAWMLHSLLPVSIDQQECGVVDAPGGPVALIFHYDLGDLMRVSVSFKHQWFEVEVPDPDDPHAVCAGELAEGRFGVERTGPDFEISVDLWEGLPTTPEELSAAFEEVVRRAVGEEGLRVLEGRQNGHGGASIWGVLSEGIEEFMFEGGAHGPFVEVVRARFSGA